MTRLGLRQGARRIAPLAWPVFVGQVAVLAFSTVDTVHGRAHVGDSTWRRWRSAPSVYISVFVGLMGVVLAVGPIAGQLFGAGKLRESGHEAAAGGVARRSRSRCPAASLLLLPEPFLALRARRAGGRREGARATCDGLAFALPPALVFTAYRGFNVAVSRPKAVMALQLGGLALKVPLNALLVFGIARRRPSARCPAGARRRGLRHRHRDRHVVPAAAPRSGCCARDRVLRAASASAAA